MSDRKHHNALQPGYRLHWYEIKRVLGRGGFGITYLALDTNLNRLVAIKEYLPIDLANRDQTDSVNPMDDDDRDEYQWGLERFISEAQTLAQFEHPNIVRVIAVFEENNTGYMVMNYEEGDELQELLKVRKTLEEHELINALLPLLDGLEKIHDAGFIHRDIKPQNIMIKPDGSPILIDFGSARQALGGKTRTLTSLVTPGYAPFEQYHTKSDKQGPWTDIYALAATLYRCILGRPPLSSIDRSESIFHGTGDIFVSAREIGEGNYSRTFLNAIDHGLKFKPEDRPQSIGEWRKDLKKIKISQKKKPSEDTIETRRAGTYPESGYQKANSSRSKSLIFGTLIFILFSLTGYYYFEDIKTGFLSPDDKPVEVGPSTAELIKHEKAKVARLEEELKIRNEQLSKLLQVDLPSANELAQKEKEKVTRIAAELVNSRNNLQLLENKAEDERRIAEEKERIEEERRLTEEKARQEQLEKEHRLAEEKARIAEQQRLADEKARQEKLEKERLATQVDELLVTAKKDLDDLKLVTPNDDNALSKYQQVLALDPDNKSARSGIDNVAKQLVTLANKEIKTGDLTKADTYLASAEEIASDTKNIVKARQLLKQKQTEHEKHIAEQEAVKQKLVEAQNQKEKISGLLATAKQDIDALRLTSPKGNNALERYQQVLDIEPDNREAISGKQSIVSKYIEFAEQAASINDYDKALSRLEKAEGITPGAESIQFSREKIRLQQESYLAEQKLLEEQKKIEEEEKVQAQALASEAQKQLEQEEREKLAVEEETSRLATAEREKLQAEIEQLRQQAEVLKQSSVNQVDNTEAPTVPTITFTIKGTDQRGFNKMGLDKNKLSEEITSLLSTAGFNVIKSDTSSGSYADMTMNLVFKPAVSAGTLWDWRTSVIVNSPSRGKIWERFIQLADTGKRKSQHVFDLTPAYEAFIDSVNEFTANNKPENNKHSSNNSLKVDNQSNYSKINLLFIGLEKEYEPMGLNKDNLTKEISNMLSAEGIQVGIQNVKLNTYDNTVMELIFRPTYYVSNNLSSWNTSIYVKERNNILFEAYDAYADTQILRLERAQNSLIELVKDFITKHKDKF